MPKAKVYVVAAFFLLVAPLGAFAQEKSTNLAGDAYKKFEQGAMGAKEILPRVFLVNELVVRFPQQKYQGELRALFIEFDPANDKHQKEAKQLAIAALFGDSQTEESIAIKQWLDLGGESIKVGKLRGFVGRTTERNRTVVIVHDK